MKILLIAEHQQEKLKPATLHTLSAALSLSQEIDVLVMGEKCEKTAEEARNLPVKQVLLANHSVYAHQLAENCATLIAEIGKEYDYILIGSTTFGKNLLPRVAALLDVNMISDVMKIISPDTFVRPIFAGNILSTVQSQDKIKLISIRTTAFPPVILRRVFCAEGSPSASRDPSSKKHSQDDKRAELKTITLEIPNTLSRFENQAITKLDRPELTTARVVISGGRGLKSAENFKLLEEIADQLHAAIGASRAAVDAGFAPNDYQVGQTGKVVAPELYIAVGISGAIQHLAGMKDSKVIVAINNDPDAPILEFADYAIVGDLFKILPELKAELDK